MFDTYIIAKLRKLEELSYSQYNSFNYIAGVYSSLLADLLGELSTRHQILDRIDALIADLEQK